MSAIEAFLVCLDLFDKIQENVDWNSKEIKDIQVIQGSHWTMYEDLRYNVCKWLSDQPSYKEELSFLEVII